MSVTFDMSVTSEVAPQLIVGSCDSDCMHTGIVYDACGIWCC